MRFLRFKDLQEQGAVKDYRELAYLIQDLGFPPGRMKGPRLRVWTDEEIAAWYQSLPTALEVRPAAKVRMSPEAKRAFDERRARRAAQVDAQ